MSHYRITVDGGALGNGTENVKCYGSALIKVSDGRRKMLRFESLPGASTNNEAEYLALATALKWLATRIEGTGNASVGYSVTVLMDSSIVINQVSRAWKVKARSLLPFRDLVDDEIAKFGSVTFDKIDQSVMKRILGH